jgi:UDP-N-acetylmuramoyl-L-alanyl-D-glutamate--2,6-diaminopimelate ligase
MVRQLIPRPVLSAYHFGNAFLGALINNFPSQRILVIGVTGTKGKSSTIEFLNVIFETAGYTTASTSTIRFKVAGKSEQNRRKMSMPGRFFMQQFLADAVKAKCNIAFIEMTSEGTLQHRHRFIQLNGLIFTNLSPEHIESHGSYDAYVQAKLSIGHALVRSKKRPRILAANTEDKESVRFLTLPVDLALPYTKEEVRPYASDERGSTFVLENTTMHVHVAGEHNMMNALAAATMARAFGIEPSIIAAGIAKLRVIPGRTEEIQIDKSQPFLAVVDYAHTPDSLRALYTSYKGRKKVCVLGAAGGGRDVWKRPEMGKIADELCDHIILTNEDPYDEDPFAITASIALGIKHTRPEIIIDRRLAIRRALELAEPGTAVLVSGKGSETTMMGPGGTKIPWSDADVLREEIARKLFDKNPGAATEPSPALA